MQKLISFFMLLTLFGGIYGCESHRNDDIQQEQERQAPPIKTHTEGNAGPVR